MEMNEIVQLIAQFGFPIAMCLLMFFNNNRTIEKLTEILNAMNTRLALIEQTLNIKGGKDNGDKYQRRRIP